MTAAEDCDLGYGSGVQISCFVKLCRPEINCTKMPNAKHDFCVLCAAQIQIFLQQRCSVG